MSYDKLMIIIPDIKRVGLKEGSSVEYSDGVAEFVTKAGKSLAIPEGQVLFQDESSITFRYPRRKILKGAFSSEDGFLVDEDSECRVNTSIIVFGETPKKKSKAEKAAAAQRGKALAAAKSGSAKAAKAVPKPKLRIKLKK